MLFRHLEENAYKELEEDEKPEWALIKSKLLDGELILVALEKMSLRKLRSEFPGIVIYFPPEIEELYKHKDDKEFIKSVHFAKKQFEGWIVPEEKEGDTDD